jgi:hypothetical protein
MTGYIMLPSWLKPEAVGSTVERTMALFPGTITLAKSTMFLQKEKNSSFKNAS